MSDLFLTPSDHNNAETLIKQESGLLMIAGPPIESNPQATGASAHSQSEDDDEDDEGEEETDDIKAVNESVRKVIDGIGTPYNSSVEGLPDLPAYHPAFTSIENCRSEIVASAISILRSAKYKDEETAQLVEQALGLQDIKYPRDRRLGLIGDSGTGTYGWFTAVI